jgi:signal transduction histidine kinase
VLSFVISMSRRALMMVDLWVNRALVYGTLVGLLIGFFLLTTWSLGVLTPFDRRWSVLITVALIGIITPSLHHAIQEGVNHIFFKEWLSARALFRDVSMELSTTLETEALTRILVTELPHRLRVTQAALFLQQPDGNLKAVDDSSGWPIPADHPLLRALVEVQSPLILSQTHDLSPLLRDLRDENWEIILPLRSGGALVGLYLLGVHLSGEFYGRSELETLSMLGERIGLTLENARLYEEVERYSENLEKLVWQRTEDLQNANRALSAERDRLQVILQNIADGLVYITPGGEVALANTAFEMMVGRTAGGMLGKTPTEADIPSFVNDLVSEARVDRGMVLTQDQDLGDRVLRLSVIGLPEHGGVIAVLRDITRDVEVDRMKSQFLSAVSHELRTPLTSILGFAKITRKFVDDRLMPNLVENEGTHQIGERVRTNLEIIAVEGHRLMALIDDVLEITAFDAGTADWDDRPCALSSLIQDAIETQREAAEAKGLRLQARISQDLPMMVVDPDRVTQLLRNLISNAVKLTKDGEVELSVGFLEPGTSIQDWHTPDSGAVLVAVRDTGLGLDFDQGAQVFERFSQIDALMDAKPTRTGLGLAICQEIVSHYKGILWVESDPDRGSTFSFTLPVGKQAEPVR